MILKSGGEKIVHGLWAIIQV